MEGIYKGVAGRVAQFLDATVTLLAPTAGLRRLEARAQRAVLLGYDAAKNTRTRRARPTVGSADSDLLPDLARLRSNSRTMVRDDATASATLSTIIENVVGGGIRARGAVSAGESTGLTQTQADDFNAATTAAFDRWMTGDADATRHADGYALQLQALGEMVRDGEVLMHRLAIDATKQPGRKFLTAFEFVDVDRLKDPTRSETDADVRGGVEIGTFGEAVAYWLLPMHPSDFLLTRRRLGERNKPVRHLAFDGDLPSLTHAFRRTRTGQNRGVPMFASVFGVVEALNDIIDSEAVASRAASKIAMVITQSANVDSLASLPGFRRQDDGAWVEKIESGTMKRLRPGETMETFAPQRPGANWDGYVQRMMRLICANFGLPYELVARDFARMSFSGARVALNEARRWFTMLQAHFIRAVLKPQWDALVYELVLTGQVKAPRGWAKDPQAFLAADWVPPSWGYVDPVTEIQASHDAVANVLSSPQIEARRQGRDWRQNLKDRVEFEVEARRLEQESGLAEGTLSLPKGPGAAPPAADPEPDEDEPQDVVPDDDGDTGTEDDDQAGGAAGDDNPNGDT